MEKVRLVLLRFVNWSSNARIHMWLAIFMTNNVLALFFTKLFGNKLTWPAGIALFILGFLNYGFWSHLDDWHRGAHFRAGWKRRFIKKCIKQGLFPTADEAAAWFDRNSTGTEVAYGKERPGV